MTRHVKRYVHEATEEAIGRERLDEHLQSVRRELNLARDIQRG